MVLKNINERNSTTISPTQRKYEGQDEWGYAKIAEKKTLTSPQSFLFSLMLCL